MDELFWGSFSLILSFLIMYFQRDRENKGH
jgi:hypothetical protein